MSRQLSKLKNLVNEIDAIQRLGQKKAPATISLKEVSPAKPELAITSAPTLTQGSTVEIPKIEKEVDRQIEQKAQEKNPEKLAEKLPEPEPISREAGKVSLELSPNVSVKLKLEESNETVEVRQIGDYLMITFADGKSVHLPLKSVA